MDEKISLNGVWQWSAADSDAVHPGIVPGSVLSDMLALNPDQQEGRYRPACG